MCIRDRLLALPTERALQQIATVSDSCHLAPYLLPLLAVLPCRRMNRVGLIVVVWIDVVWIAVVWIVAGWNLDCRRRPRTWGSRMRTIASQDRPISRRYPRVDITSTDKSKCRDRNPPIRRVVAPNGAALKHAPCAAPLSGNPEGRVATSSSTSCGTRTPRPRCRIPSPDRR